MSIPASFRSGSTIKWRDDAVSDPFGEPMQSTDGWSLKYYIRTNAALGHTATGTEFGTGWEFTISATSTASLTAGDYFWQSEASKGAEKYEIGTGQLEILQSLTYTGNATAINDKSQIQQDLEAIQSAIRTLVSGGVVKEYSIGGRSLKKYELSDLMTLESRYKFQLKREQKAQDIANGLGNPHQILVRF